MQVGSEIALRLFGADTGDHIERGVAQPRKPAPRDLRVGIADRNDNSGHPGLDQRRGARRRVAVMVTGLERAVGGRAPGPVARRAQRRDLGMRPGGKRTGGAFADDLALARQHAADGGPRRAMATRGAGEFDRPAHQLVVAHVPFPVRARGTCWRR